MKHLHECRHCGALFTQPHSSCPSCNGHRSDSFDARDTQRLKASEFLQHVRD